MLFHVVEMCTFMVSLLRVSRPAHSDLSHESLYNITLWHHSQPKTCPWQTQENVQANDLLTRHSWVDSKFSAKFSGEYLTTETYPSIRIYPISLTTHIFSVLFERRVIPESDDDHSSPPKHKEQFLSFFNLTYYSLRIENAVLTQKF